MQSFIPLRLRLKRPLINSNPHLHKEKEMVDFRKALLLLAVLVFATGIASAQVFNPLSCTANAGVPPLLRSEGVAEEVGQVTINCVGGVPTVIGAPIPTVNVIIFLSTNLTSRLLPAGSSTPSYSEAMLLIDEPQPGAQLLCPVNTVCPMTSANGNGDKATYNGTSTGGVNRYNMWAAVKNAENSVAWLGVPVDPPGSQNNRVIRLVNVRANASIVPGVGVGLVPPAVSMTISITGTGSLTLTNPVLTVGFVTPGLIQGKGTTVDLKQCELSSRTFTITAEEGFANAFRAVGTTSQNSPGTIYNTESMFTPGNPANAGVATQATRLMVRFTNIPLGISITVPNVIYSNGTSSSSGAADSTADKWCYVATPNTNGSGGTISCASGSTTVISSTATGRSGIAVFDLVGLATFTGTSSGVVETVTQASQVSAKNNVNIVVTAGRNKDNNPLPQLGSGSYSVSFAPISGSPFMSSTESAPRFVETGSQAVGLNVTACRTNLLWPYVTSASGFDTGLAISNTSLDPFGTQTQTGACRVSYYGPKTGLPSRVSIGEIKPGEYKAWLVSSGGVGDLTGVPAFTGYVIAQCDFQFAHGYGFITNPGETRWAQGYLALILDADMYDMSAGATRTGDRSETLKH
jgi:hypothetical protein